jgi:hypothetical protein
MSGPVPTLSNSDEQGRSFPSTAGILKSRNDADVATTSSRHSQVSFSRRKDGSIRNHIASFDVHALPKECTKETARRSLRDSMNWPPPPPPRDKSFSALFRENQMVSLPFGAAPAPALSSSRPVRRYSTIEIARDEKAAAFHRLPLSRRRSDGDHNRSQQSRIQGYSGARSDYSLGDKVKCSSHMIIQDDPQEAFSQVSRLKQHDFAFIKRTDGLWTYAILAHRYVDDEGEECMMFVMHQIGSTKTITKRKWVSFVRLVADKRVTGEEPLESSLPRNILMDSLGGDDVSRISYFS